MKKLISIFAILLGFNAWSQTDIWYSYPDGDNIHCHFAVQILDSAGNPVGIQHNYLTVDTLMFNIKTDSVRMIGLDQYHLYAADPQNVVWTDSVGTLYCSPVDSLNINWSQINNVPSFGTGTVTSVDLSSSDLSISGSPVTTSGSITADLTTTGVAAGTYDWVTVDTKGRVTSAANAPLPTTIAAGGRNFNQAYQISFTRPTTISVSVQISCSLSLSGGQAGNVQLQISANGTSGWITVAQLTASNTGTLTIGLNTTQVSGGQLVYEGLPAGYYWRVLTTNTTGTPTYTFNGGFEKVY